MIKFLKKNLAKISVGLGALGLMVLPAVSRAADFDATDTQSILTSAIGTVTPTLKYGVGAILVLGLGIWVVFFIVGKMKKHVK